MDNLEVKTTAVPPATAIEDTTHQEAIAPTEVAASGPRRSIIMLGNPGAGKSTLLSSLIKGQAIFPSGISIGKGKTAILQQETYHGTTYVDTPGLSDVRRRQEAAIEIEKALKMAGKCKVFFIVTLESGRVRPDDIATIKLVLDAAIQIGPNQYSIIINKMQKQVIEMLNESAAERKELATFLVPPSYRVGTNSIFHVPQKRDWVDQSNKWGELSPDLLRFIEDAPEVILSPESVRPIQYNQFEKVVEELMNETQLLREDNARLRRAMEERERALGKLTWTPQFSGTILFFGNSGVGKSTLLTSLMEGVHKFRSGISFGEGITTMLHEVEYNGTTYIETPALSDPQRRNNAAEQIQRAIMKSGKVKLFFVITLESGRFNSDDLATIELVMTMCKFAERSFSVIVNKVSNEVLEELKTEENSIILTDLLRARGFTTNSIFYIPRKSAWDDKENQWGPLEDLFEFITTAPQTKITGNVSLNIELYESAVENMRTALGKLKVENSRLSNQIENRKKKKNVGSLPQ